MGGQDGTEGSQVHWQLSRKYFRKPLWAFLVFDDKGLKLIG